MGTATGLLKSVIHFISTFLLSAAISGIIIFVVFMNLKHSYIPVKFIQDVWIILFLIGLISLIGIFFELITGNISYALGLLCGFSLTAFITYVVTKNTALAPPDDNFLEAIKGLFTTGTDSLRDYFS